MEMNATLLHSKRWMCGENISTLTSYEKKKNIINEWSEMQWSASHSFNIYIGILSVQYKEENEGGHIVLW